MLYIDLNAHRSLSTSESKIRSHCFSSVFATIILFSSFDDRVQRIRNTNDLLMNDDGCVCLPVQAFIFQSPHENKRHLHSILFQNI